MLSQAVGYASCALGRLAAAGGAPLLIKDIAEDCEIPSAYLAKIVHTLARRGLLTTQRGVGGGVSLARPPQEITLYDIATALDDTITQSRCMLATAPCSDDRSCPAHKFWKEHKARLLDFMQHTTVSDIAAFETRKRWRHLVPGQAADTSVTGVSIGIPTRPSGTTPDGASS